MILVEYGKQYEETRNQEHTLARSIHLYFKTAQFRGVKVFLSSPHPQKSPDILIRQQALSVQQQSVANGCTLQMRDIGTCNLRWTSFYRTLCA